MRFVLGLITFVVLWAAFLFVLGWRVSTPHVVPPPEIITCPPVTTVPGPSPLRTTTTVTATRAVWLRRGDPCPGVVVPTP
ncbi:hypothetical protein ACQPXB_40725 [Amycolatopsis sp. CA-161197]|uniref:hypothetical protein n=1 Tax=Amycolatopsis sp. CA-161197 TaxID=3239922 RepID=UPI003D91FA48